MPMHPVDKADKERIARERLVAKVKALEKHNLQLAKRLAATNTELTIVKAELTTAQDAVMLAHKEIVKLQKPTRRRTTESKNANK